MFARPPCWPVRPFLPVTRHLPENNKSNAVCFTTPAVLRLYSYWATVFQVNLLDLAATEAEFLARPHYTNDTFEELANDGWVVD